MDNPIPATLSKGHEVEGINMKLSDDGEIIVSWTIYKPSRKNSESTWEDHTIVCETCAEAWDKLESLYRLKLAAQFKQKGIKCE